MTDATATSLGVQPLVGSVVGFATGVTHVSSFLGAVHTLLISCCAGGCEESSASGPGVCAACVFALVYSRMYRVRGTNVWYVSLPRLFLAVLLHLLQQRNRQTSSLSHANLLLRFRGEHVEPKVPQTPLQLSKRVARHGNMLCSLADSDPIRTPQ